MAPVCAVEVAIVQEESAAAVVTVVRDGPVTVQVSPTGTPEALNPSNVPVLVAARRVGVALMKPVAPALHVEGVPLMVTGTQDAVAWSPLPSVAVTLAA